MCVRERDRKLRGKSSGQNEKAVRKFIGHKNMCGNK